MHPSNIRSKVIPWGAFVGDPCPVPPETELGAPDVILPKYCRDLFSCLALTLRGRAQNEMSSPLGLTRFPYPGSSTTALGLPEDGSHLLCYLCMLDP